MLQEGPDQAMNAVLLPMAAPTQEALEAVLMDAVLTFSDKENAAPLADGGILRPGKHLTRLELGGSETRFHIEVPQSGAYALFTQHHPDEFQAVLRGPVSGSAHALRWPPGSPLGKGAAP